MWDFLLLKYESILTGILRSNLYGIVIHLNSFKELFIKSIKDIRFPHILKSNKKLFSLFTLISEYIKKCVPFLGINRLGMGGIERSPTSNTNDQESLAGPMRRHISRTNINNIKIKDTHNYSLLNPRLQTVSEEVMNQVKTSRVPLTKNDSSSLIHMSLDERRRIGRVKMDQILREECMQDKT